MKHKLCIVIASGLLSGCASMAVTEDRLTQRTASALGLESSDFTIGNRVDEGVRTDYTVTTKKGKKYSCYVTGVISVTGRTVSDALCNEMAGAQNKPVTRTCNDLLRAAGRCK